LKVRDPAYGKRVMTISRHFMTTSSSHITETITETARLWDAETGTEIAVLKGREGSASRAAFSPDGKRVVTTSDTMARLWDAETETEIAALRLRGPWKGEK
jgi:WD40 repeat protein